MLQVKTTIMEISGKVSSLSGDVASLKSADGAGGGSSADIASSKRFNVERGGDDEGVHALHPTLSWNLSNMFSRSPPADPDDGVQNSKPWPRAQNHSPIPAEMQTVVRNVALDLVRTHGAHKACVVTLGG